MERKNKEKKENEENNKEKIEDVTKYGEFISSYFSWLTPEKQRKIVKKLEDLSR